MTDMALTNTYIDGCMCVLSYACAKFFRHQIYFSFLYM